MNVRANYAIGAVVYRSLFLSSVGRILSQIIMLKLTSVITTKLRSITILCQNAKFEVFINSIACDFMIIPLSLEIRLYFILL